MNWEVGQKVCCVVSVFRRTQVTFPEITIVGRKWIHLSNREKFHKEEGYLDGGQYVSPGRIYVDENEYLDAVELKDSWHGFKRKIDKMYFPPSHLTAKEIKAVEAIIFPA